MTEAPVPASLRRQREPSPEYWLSHLSPYLGLIVLSHLHLIYNCTYKQHTYTHPLRSLDLPRLSPLSIFPFHSVFPGSYSCLVPRSSDTLLVTLTRTVSSWTLISAACPDHPACFSDHVSALPSLFLLLVIDPFLFDHSNKAANGSHSVWCVVTLSQQIRIWWHAIQLINSKHLQRFPEPSKWSLSLVN